MSAESGGGAASLLEEFFVRLGVKTDTAGFEKFKASLGSVRHAMEAMGVYAAVELGQKLLGFVERSVGVAAGMQDLSEIINIPAETIEAFNAAALEGSVSAGEMQGALEGLTRAAGAAAAGFPRYAKVFEMMGLDAKDLKGISTEELFSRVSEKFEDMDAGMRMAVAGRLGVSPMLATLMAKGGGEDFLENVANQKKTGLLTAIDYERADRADIVIQKLHKTIRQVATLIATELSPAIERAIKVFETWWMTVRSDALTKVGDWLWIVIYYAGVLYDWVGKLAKGVGTLWDSLTFGLLPGFKGVVAAVIALEGIKLALWVRGVVSALAGLVPMLGVVSLVIYGIMGLVSIYDQMYNNAGVTILWLRDKWRDLLEVINSVAEAILKVPGVKRVIDFMWQDPDKQTQGGVASDFLARRAKQKGAADAANKREQPDILTADGRGIWFVKENVGSAIASARAAQSTNVKIDTVQIAADKGREATVGTQLKGQISSALANQSSSNPFKS
jgi:hypothetical protein